MEVLVFVVNKKRISVPFWIPHSIRNLIVHSYFIPSMFQLRLVYHMERSLAVRKMCFRIEIGILIYMNYNSSDRRFLAERKDVMDTRTIRTLMDINALQSLGTVQGFADQK